MFFSKHNNCRSFLNEPLCLYGMQWFRDARHTVKWDPIICNTNIRNFVYLDINHNQVLSPFDLCVLDEVKFASYLFSNGKEYFGSKNHNDKIDYYCMSLFGLSNHRSQNAYEVHRVLSRLTNGNYSVVLFEANGSFMFSLAERHRDNTISVILSNWFTYEEITESVLQCMDAASFSNSSVADFFYDFAYYIARPYYLYLPSKYNSRNSNYCLEGTNERLYFDVSYLSEYENDIVVEANDHDTQWMSTDDLTLDLYQLTEEIDDEDESNTEDIDDDYEETTTVIDLEDENYKWIDHEIFDDPIKLLKLLEEKETIPEVG